MSEQTANLCTTDAAESLRAVVAERDREIERLKEGQSILILARDEQKRLANEYRDLWSRAALKSHPSGVVLPPRAKTLTGNELDTQLAEAYNDALDEVARLNSSPVSAGEPVYQFQCREIGEGDWGPCDHIRYMYCQKSPEMDTRVVQVLALSAPGHGEQVRDGWRLVPVEPTDAMLEAGDKYIGTPATYKSMLSACPSPAITKDFSQFLSAVMDAAGLIRHGRQSKELSEYLGMKCMEYRGAALSAPSHGEQVREWVPVSERLPETKAGTDADFVVAIRRAHNGKTYVVPASFLNRFELYSEDEAADDEGRIYVTGWYREMADDEYDTSWHKMETEGDVITHWQELPAAPSAGSQEQGE